MQFHIKKTNIELLDSCLLCKNRNLKTLSQIFYKKQFEIFSTSVCPKCLYIFRSTRPFQNWLEKNWIKRDKFQKKNKVNFLNSKIETDRRKRYNQLFDLISKKINFNSILDIGCGPGPGLIDLKSRKNVFGMEADPSRAQHAKKLGIKVFQNRLEKNKIKRKFDLVTCIQSLEHFYNPIKSIKKIKKLIKANGYLFIEVPNFFNHVHSWHDALYLGHNSNFIEFSLVELFKVTNLKVEHIFYTQTGIYNEYNLSFLVKNESSAAKELNYDKQNLFTKIKKKYLNGLKKRYMKNSSIVKFNLNIINDLSLMYKPKQETKLDLKKNIFRRNCEFDNKINMFLINNKIFNYKIKKNKKDKKILERRMA